MFDNILKELHIPTIVICGLTIYDAPVIDITLKPQYTSIYEPFRLPIDYISDPNDVFCLAKSVSDDLELSVALDTSCIYHHILNPTHKFGEMMMSKWNQKYTTNVTFLKDSQRVLSITELYKDKMKDSNYIINVDRIMDIWDDIKNNRHFMDIYSYVDFPILKELNESPEFLQMLSYANVVSPLISFLLPLIILIMPFFIMKIQGIPITFSIYIDVLKDVAKNNIIGKMLMQMENFTWDKAIYMILTIGFYIFQVYQNVTICTRHYKNTHRINEYLLDMRDYLNHSVMSMRAFADTHKDNDSYSEFCNELTIRSEKLSAFEQDLRPITHFCHNVSKFNDVGYMMKQYYKLHDSVELEENIRYSFGFAGYIDNIIGIYNNLAARTINFATFTPSANLDIIGQYYPPHKEEKYVKNDCKFDKNMIISGPNASGKSTLIKTTCINILFTQIFGCGFYVTCDMTPYNRIHTYLNIPDTSGRDSLFQAESRRCKEIVDIIQSSPKDRHFCIFDELFSGTNPVEATNAGYALLAYISKFRNVDFILTTHYTEICKRFNKTKRIRNYKMKAIIDAKTEKIKYTYKIRRGISKIHGAINVLKDMNFPEEIIQNVKNFS